MAGRKLLSKRARWPAIMAAALCVTLAESTVHAEEAAPIRDDDSSGSAQARRLDRQEALIANQASELAELKQLLAALRTEVERLRSGAAPPPARVAENAQPPAVAVAAEAGNEARRDAPPADVSPVLERASVLTPYHHWSLEPSLQYAYSSKNQVSIFGVSILPAITVGLIDIERVSQTTTIAALTTRFGVARRTEVELRVPYVYGDQETVGRPFGAAATSDSTIGARGRGVGDVELASRYQIASAGAALPYLIGEVRLRAPSGKGPFDVPVDAATGVPKSLPTGSGFWGALGGMTAIFPSDPAVFFGSVNYLTNIGRHVAGVGYVKPGNSAGLNFGMGISLNESASFSVGYEHDWLGTTTEAGVPLPSTTGLQVGRLLVGYSYRLGPRTSINVSLAIGATDAAPNSQLTLRVPYSL